MMDPELDALSTEKLLELATVYDEGGRGFRQDKARSTECYRRAAERGDEIAAGAYGIRLIRGTGAEVDIENGFRWLEVGARAHPNFAYLLGRQWANGCNPAHTADNHRALPWFKLAADNGVPDAKAFLGLLYLGGIADDGKEDEGRRLIDEAADEGSQFGREFQDKYRRIDAGEDPSAVEEQPMEGPSPDEGAFEWRSVASFLLGAFLYLIGVIVAIFIKRDGGWKCALWGMGCRLVLVDLPVWMWVSIKGLF